MKQVVCKLDECPRYLKPMDLLCEYTNAWQFRCPVCRNVRVATKDKVGGTIGAGLDPSGPKGLGKGF